MPSRCEVSAGIVPLIVKEEIMIGTTKLVMNAAKLDNGTGQARVPIARVEQVHPGLAAKYLETSTGNRPIRPRLVSKYARDMAGGGWRMTHAGIAFDENGALFDGHHRLAAVIESGATIPMLVFRGLPYEARYSTDGGEKRSFADLVAGYPEELGLDLLTADAAKRASSIAGVAYAFAFGRGTNPNYNELAAFVRRHPVSVAGVAAESRRLPSTNSALLYPLMALYEKNHQSFVEAVDGLSTGALLRRGSPLLVLRDYWQTGNRVGVTGRGQRDLREIQLQKTVRALSAHHNGESLTMLRPTSIYLEPFLGTRESVRGEFRA